MCQYFSLMLVERAPAFHSYLLASFFAIFLVQISSASDLQSSIARISDSLATNWKEQKAWHLLEIELGSSDSRKIILGGEGGLAFFHTGSDGQFPNGPFRVDEAKLFLSAPIWKEVYVFAELNLLTREADQEDFRLGEFYLQFENISRFWDQEGALNVRVGRFDIPFGEEYLNRDSIDNPLISHSLADLWGVDEGVEVYGRMKRIQYVIAVQNGGQPLLNDFNPDKAVVGRVRFSATPQFHFSVSAMRTGDLNPIGDELSELWFGNGFLRALGELATTTSFHGNLLQGDAALEANHGYLHAAGGYLQYDDNDSSADHQRDVYYYSFEAVPILWKENQRQFYTALRFSQILADQGFPIVGHGQFGRYFFNPGDLTESLWRLSFGFGYRYGRNLLLKAEYTFEHGKEINGTERNKENFLAAEVALKF